MAAYHPSAYDGTDSILEDPCTLRRRLENILIDSSEHGRGHRRNGQASLPCV